MYLKMFNSFRVILLLLILTSSSCTDTVKINLPSTTPILAVDGSITDKTAADTIFLYKTQNYFNNNPNLVISGAVLRIDADNGQTENLIEVQPGKYVISTIRAQKGVTYTLSINYLSQQYSASTLCARSSPRIDSIRFLYLEKGLRVDTTGLYTVLYGQELPGPGDHVRFVLYRNGKLANRAADLNILDDRLIDGKYLKKLQVLQRSPFKRGDVVELQALSLSQAYYDFYTDLRTELINGGIFSKTPVNVRTNIINLNTKGSQATGYFGSSLVTQISSLAY